MFKHDLGDGAELRLLGLRHAQEFLDFINGNKSFLSKFLPWGETLTNKSEVEAWLQRGVIRYAEDALPWMGLWVNGVMQGGVLFFPLDKQTNSTEIGYWLGESATGKGLMFKAARAALAYVFEELKINRVALHADVTNTKSRALAERLGFVLEGIERQSWMLRGQYTDNASYSMLSSDWQKLK